MRKYSLRLNCSNPSRTIPKYFPLKAEEGTVTIGRDPSKVNIWLDSTRVPNMISRIHAQLQWMPTEQTWQIIDKGSVNGVFVNEIKVTQHKLKKSDLITFGGGAMCPMGNHISQPNSEFQYYFEEIQTTPTLVPSCRLPSSDISPLKRKSSSLDVNHQEQKKKMKRLEELEKEHEELVKRRQEEEEQRKRNEEQRKNEDEKRKIEEEKRQKEDEEKQRKIEEETRKVEEEKRKNIRRNKTNSNVKTRSRSRKEKTC